LRQINGRTADLMLVKADDVFSEFVSAMAAPDH
jgi:hypothetical protein